MTPQTKIVTHTQANTYTVYISTDSMNHLLQLPTKSPLLISWQAEVQRVINCRLECYLFNFSSEPTSKIFE